MKHAWMTSAEFQECVNEWEALTHCCAQESFNLLPYRVQVIVLERLAQASDAVGPPVMPIGGMSV